MTLHMHGRSTPESAFLLTLSSCPKPSKTKSPCWPTSWLPAPTTSPTWAPESSSPADGPGVRRRCPESTITAGDGFMKRDVLLPDLVAVLVKVLLSAESTAFGFCSCLLGNV